MITAAETSAKELALSLKSMGFTLAQMGTMR